jgi:hypothetical protein
MAVGVAVTGEIVGDALGADRVGGAPPQEGPDSRRSEKPPLSEKPPRPRPAPRAGGLYPRGPDGGITGPSGLDAVLIDETGGGDRTGTVRFRLPLGPVGGLKLAGPRGGERVGPRTGDRGAGDGATSLCGCLTGDLSRGVDLAESLESLKGRAGGAGDLSLSTG